MLSIHWLIVSCSWLQHAQANTLGQSKLNPTTDHVTPVYRSSWITVKCNSIQFNSIQFHVFCAAFYCSKLSQRRFTEKQKGNWVGNQSVSRGGRGRGVVGGALPPASCNVYIPRRARPPDARGSLRSAARGAHFCSIWEKRGARGGVGRRAKALPCPALTSRAVAI
ncbi:hypothetical protein ANANG_G00296770 [Anguilla anguilla]|uniref:Secreted protein n=1 Tax=Anguilla anguilla TaxID=7936 RepID=A0A9D3LNX8_ANGAN|nr:hypothetical protein ANANG_G00296770 [Anguilla anguilla]